MTIEVAEKKHAVLSPSGWATWGNCPGSVPLSEGIVKQSSEYADEGTAAHALLERCLNENANAEDYLGEQIIVGTRSFTVDEEMAGAINSSIEIIRGYDTHLPDVILQTEQDVPLAFMTGETDAEGTSDNAIIREGGKHLVIIDFKYGKGVMVYASENWVDGELAGKKPNGQLAMYALGWLQKYGMVYDEVEKVTLVVLQPRLEWVDEYTLSVDQLREFETVVREAAGAVEMELLAQANGDELTLVPGDKQCKFCDAKAICPALKSFVSTSLATIAPPSKTEEFEDLTLPKQAAAVEVSPDATNEKLAEFMRAVPLIEDAIKAVRAEVERRLMAGQQVPGFYLGVGRQGNRKWKDPELALAELTKSGRLKMMEALERTPISPTAAEKLFKDKGKLDSKGWKDINLLIDRAPGKPSVCREGDKNEPYKLASAVEDFAPIDTPKIVTSKSTATGDGLYVEASDGSHVVIPGKDAKGPIVKLTHVGEPMAALLAALEPSTARAAEDISIASMRSAMAALLE